MPFGKTACQRRLFAVGCDAGMSRAAGRVVGFAIGEAGEAGKGTIAGERVAVENAIERPAKVRVVSQVVAGDTVAPATAAGCFFGV